MKYKDVGWHDCNAISSGGGSDERVRGGALQQHVGANTLTVACGIDPTASAELPAW